MHIVVLSQSMAKTALRIIWGVLIKNKIFVSLTSDLLTS
jgi:hypothetical protein